MSITLEQLGAQTKAKYPTYAGLSDVEVGQKVLDKYPVYKSQITQADPSLEQKLSQQGYQGQVALAQLEGGKKIASSISKGANDIQSGVDMATTNPIMGALKTVYGGAKAAFGTIIGASQVVAAPITPAMPTVIEGVRMGAPVVDYALKAYDAVAPKIKEVTEKYPEASTLVSDIVNTLLIATGGKSFEGSLTKEGLSTTAKTAVSDIKAIPTQVKSLLQPSEASKVSTIQDMIQPKATVKEARLAQTQGRFVEGKKPTLFKAGTEDTILPSAKTQSASQTIIKNIPDAQKLSPTELYKAVDNKITETATTLRPKMEATPIEPVTIEKLNTDWENIKKQQMLDAPATEEPNVMKRQLKFESFLKKSGSNTQADLWDTRIAYDDSIPANVKKANTLSSESLQLQREEWLQNRQILNDAFEANSKPEFKTMTDLYEAKNGILSQTKVEGSLPSKFSQWLKDNPNKAMALKAALGIEGLRLLGIDPLKLIP